MDPSCNISSSIAKNKLQQAFQAHARNRPEANVSRFLLFTHEIRPSVVQLVKK